MAQLWPVRTALFRPATLSANHPLIDYKYNFGYNFNAKFITDMGAIQETKRYYK